jgi:hypothetical protein
LIRLKIRRELSAGEVALQKNQGLVVGIMKLVFVNLNRQTRMKLKKINKINKKNKNRRRRE